MKGKIFVSVFVFAVLFALTSCTGVADLFSGPHTHTFDVAWSSDSENHWHASNCGHTEEKFALNPHSDTENDGICDICSKKYYTPVHVHTFSSEWEKDANNHWHAATCEHLEEISDFEAHSDKENDGICNVCFEKYYEPHIHIFDDKWSMDSEKHWHSALCEHTEEKADSAEHSDSDSDGGCDVCEYGKLTGRTVHRLFTNGDINNFTVNEFEYLLSSIYDIEGTYEINWTGEIIIKINGVEMENGGKIYSESKEIKNNVEIYSKNKFESTECSITFKYHILNDFATVMSDSGVKNNVAEGTNLIFIDREYTWSSKIPSWLRGRSCIKGMLSNGPNVTVTGAGWLYVLTPVTGTVSQTSALEEEGFRTVTVLDEGVLSAKISGKIALMGKKFEAGESFKYPGAWIVLIAELDESYVDTDPREWSMEAPDVVSYPENQLDEHPEYSKYLDGERIWQGMASIAKDNVSGRLWATWYSGGTGEGSENFVVLYTSSDDGVSWTGPAVVVDPSKPHVRAFDPNLWTDPEGRVWLIWTQSYEHTDGRFGVWAIHTENPGDSDPEWSEPVRIANGVGICDPIVLNSAVGDLPEGTWILPAAIWNRDVVPEDLEFENHPNCYVSFDKGESWTLYGSVPSTEAARTYDENMIVENSDGTLTMYIRTEGGIEKSTSADGKNWSPSVNAGITQTSARFWIGRLDSGTLLAVYNAEGRRHMTAALSYDDGKTWTHKIEIYEPYSIYPDVHIDDKGNIYIITCENPFDNMKINMAKITKMDIVAGRIVTSGSYLRTVINDNTK